ncbi:MAG: RDD family protein, partial [Thermomicrobiaceae bacterium]
MSDDLSPWRRILALLIDLTLLGVSVLIVLLVTVIIYLNVAILVGGTYEERIPQFWIEILLVGPALLLSIVTVWLYFSVFGRTG